MKNQFVKKTGLFAIVLAVAAMALLGLSGCSSSDDNAVVGAPKVKDGKTTLIVGASPVPHAQILEQVKSDLAKEDIELEIVEYSDYVVPNTALNDGDINANFFQHQPYLDDFNEKNGTDLVSVGAIHFEPLGIYPGKSSSLSNINNGAKIAVPSDTTNEARALMLLEAEGIITLKDGVDIAATATDIKDNPHNIEIVEAEAASIPRLLNDVDLAVINGNYVLSSGIDPEGVLASEKADSLAAKTYANVVVVRKGNEDNDAIKKLMKALQSDKIRTYIDDTYQGLVVPVF